MPESLAMHARRQGQQRSGRGRHPGQIAAGSAVIKISAPHPGNVDEHRALGLWRGHGSVVVLDHDADEFAPLLERVEDRQPDVPPDEGIVIAGELSARLAVPAPPQMKRLADTVDEWEQQVRAHARQSGQLLPDRVLGAAIETIRDLGQDHTPTMLHGDLHGKNILHSDRGWVVIDPQGMAGTAAYDAVTMFCYGIEGVRGAPVAEAVRRITLFSEAAGVDPALSRRCVHARSVTGLLWHLSRGAIPRSPNFDLRRALADGLLR